ncbi:uncharacterized protein THITE_2106286 [Thermothielavioides terrestris NRRL 8126]|jgi:hypothetical protein|uniref:Uncharacterized protein n=1 Tax=Thermothielavioides terrestris (strain ATCC 38088 / NRRL 8126) TaxID=578455 RepID=G2QX61_THETT|nr:uncharacterized protein THITE_2106286 [Thermothielavioides terrestris NRRL 8126]AEO62282.1 hypothetical protein THITE_2106286 [Thermothielavioides terrestris NRRL 8126]
MPYHKKRRVEAESDTEPQVTKKQKGETAAQKDLSKGQDADGNAYWEVGHPRLC